MPVGRAACGARRRWCRLRRLPRRPAFERAPAPRQPRSSRSSVAVRRRRDACDRASPPSGRTSSAGAPTPRTLPAVGGARCSRVRSDSDDRLRAGATPGRRLRPIASSRRSRRCRATRRCGRRSPRPARSSPASRRRSVRARSRGRAVTSSSRTWRSSSIHRRSRPWAPRVRHADRRSAGATHPTNGRRGRHRCRRRPRAVWSPRRARRCVPPPDLGCWAGGAFADRASPPAAARSRRRRRSSRPRPAWHPAARRTPARPPSRRPW